MGVLVGRFPGKVKEGFLEQKKKKRLAEAVKAFTVFAQSFGLAAAQREVDFWINAPGGNILTGLENYGVAVCDSGTRFWRNEG